ncbi:MAG: ferrous iron transport protein B [Flavobacteriales bacterium]|nr:ferrous iron transport protein B [Flavobacteriales bacterium]
MKSSVIKVALIGNPNTGKTSVFNRLTGLNQQVGNYPGITVEKKQGICDLPNGTTAKLLDLPGTYSLNASSLDENVVIELLLNKNHEDYPDVAIVVADVENLKRNLLLFTQIKDLEIPTLLVINMADRMGLKGISLDIPLLEKLLKTKIVLVSSRKNTGIDKIKESIVNYQELSDTPCVNASVIDPEYFNNLRKAFPNQSLYKLWLVITQDVNFANLDRKTLNVPSFVKPKSELKRLQQKETIKRYQFINEVLKQGLKIDAAQARDLRSRLDKILTHRVFGYLIFLFILFSIFQSIFEWSSLPMDYIDGFFADMSQFFRSQLPSGIFTDLIAEGLIPGIGGVVIFIPQIAFLFLFIAVLEESGYMSRVVFLMDKIMKRFGLSGKSIVPLISGTACAIPAIMATRNIENWKERLITILVTPFITCSARLPVYSIIIALVIPDVRYLGLINLQGLMLMLLYFIGFIVAIVSAYILNKTMKYTGKSFFVVEMPNYKLPLFKNVLYTVIEKTKSFVFGAGKIILSLSIVLWFLASYGVGENFDNSEEIVKRKYQGVSISDEKLNHEIESYRLENSLIGVMGKAIEPAIEPLGYDWKIGVALVSSFAAREVFVSTLATIYSVGGGNDTTIKQRMQSEINPNTGGSRYTFATGMSLLLFYAFAMQCMSTLAVTKKETNSWQWPLVQLVSMTALAYISALLAYQIFS